MAGITQTLFMELWDLLGRVPEGRAKSFLKKNNINSTGYDQYRMKLYGLYFL
jgi:hypothetical protein